MKGGRRLLAPEVVQTSAMDCGPASLKSLLEGHRIHVSYGRLREACQTQVDGTSIDTLEEVSAQLGLSAEQVMLPPDHLFLPETMAFPAILVVVSANDATHFVVVWNRLGPFVQVMDPASGRRWITTARLLEEVYVHSMPVAASGFDEWLRSDEFLLPLRRRLDRLAAGACHPLIEASRSSAGWRALAALDAAVRMVAALVEAGGIRRGEEAAATIRVLHERALGEGSTIPERFWTATETEPDEAGEPRVRLRGALLVRVRGRHAPDGSAGDRAPLSPELVAALAEEPSRPGRDFLATLRNDGVLAPSFVLLGTLLVVVCTLVEALLLRGVLDVSKRLGLYEQRLAAGTMLVVFLVGYLLLELALEGSVLRIGRRLEARLRLAFQAKIPRLADRYFQSRPASDMAERAHGAHAIRALPELGAQVVRSALELVVTAGALVWLDPRSVGLVAALAVSALFPPLFLQGTLAERDAKLRTHAGALTRFHLDALLGITPLLAHGGERALTREHEGLLTQWIRSGRALVRVSAIVQATHAILTSAAVISVVGAHVSRTSEPSTLLLFLYWALSLPAIGEELGMLARQYPSMKSRMQRLLEPLGAIDDAESGALPRSAAPHEAGPGVAITLAGVDVLVGGRPVLEEVSLSIASGEHVAIVGVSGAGKSSLVGLLLGFHGAARGEVLVDGSRLEGDRLAGLRRSTAWVDPAVHLWNRSLAENLAYGNEAGHEVGPAVHASGLRAVLDRLSDGLQTVLGEGGALVSGGEGQRVRLGRAFARRGARLVILDEPFRGLDRSARNELLGAIRQRFANATLLFVSHDIEDTLSFDRALVIEDGRIAEDGAPRALASEPSSRYRALLDADRRVRETIWSGRQWRRVMVDRGVVQDVGEPS